MTSTDKERRDAMLDRVLARGAQALGNSESNVDNDSQFDLAERAALKRVAGLSTELEDITEVEYRQVRLEKVVLAGLWNTTLAEAENSIRELAALAETAGSEVLDAIVQRRETPDPGTYLGKGKAAELAEIVASVGADTVIIDSELAPSQRRGLEDVIKVKVVDRVALILDIFAQHAKSREGKAQVELAQLEYLLPRLRGWGESLSRQAGGRVAGGAGIGSRGPGETKIELDRRRIRARMSKLRRQIAAMAPSRSTKRKNRARNHIPSVAIVGYTNAGKSSLLNQLTDAEVMVQNALFATLDPTVRQSRTADGITFTYTDTVGFVRNLPHQLVEAFRSTLEEASDSDLLLHIVDASHSDPHGQIHAVREVLKDVDTGDIPELLVFNKADLADEAVVTGLHAEYPEARFVSAVTREGVPELVETIDAMLPSPNIEVTVLIPYQRGDLVSKIYALGMVEHEEHGAGGTAMQAKVPAELAAELADFRRPDLVIGE
ncbi:MAG: GTPase HflX [Brevibacterium sp.]|uniref:GTPase HflX n=1 Tax=Brevibacterium sp. TaxID=1701 RepID=UPI0026494743|nr:GTPase HflX [Brevibacterium sp.]MDN5806415.1 GTPase HflX [Brevibacterium sp.]MDN5834913.1 GTPase HflX [Brevibacterium sp.]MDN5876892.1 GTPase HflX [Brevibacterium sp.]MDN5908588.1 GTPase HflX [Brevibacterium sp.]MDN6134218.1 GTPase HflX [Brevibacterium sp.]